MASQTGIDGHETISPEIRSEVMTVRSAELIKHLWAEIDQLSAGIQDARNQLAPLEDEIRVVQDNIVILCTLRNKLEIAAKGLEEPV